MSFKKICWLFGVPLAAFAGIIFYLYGHQLGEISNHDGPWSSFGSLLSGVFTLVGAVATIGTLLFLSQQNKDMQKVTQAQLDTLTFERYLNHRKLFTDHLNELLAVHKNIFQFRDPSHLYNSIFTSNSPHHCSFSVSPSYAGDGVGTNHIGTMLVKLNRLKEFFDKTDFKDSEREELLILLIGLASDIFMIEPVGSQREGDVCLYSVSYGFNVFSLEHFVEPCLSIANMILRFTNNDLINSSAFKSRSKFVREALMKRYLSSANHGSVNIKRIIKGVPIFAHVFFAARELHDGEGFLFPSAVQLLNVSFSSAHAVNLFSDDDYFSNLLDLCLNEVSEELETMTSRDEHYLEVVRIQNHLISLIDHKQSK